jgi:acyl-coenzyme A synthetase/AMP-(fatty) acid ligase
VKGLQLAPAELEDILLSSPKIQDCCVVGIKDPDAGEGKTVYIYC